VLLQRAEGHRRRAHRKRETDDHHALPATVALEEEGPGDGRRREHVLRRPQPDHHAPHRPEACGADVQAQEEEQEDDADLSDGLELVDVLDAEQWMR